MCSPLSNKKKTHRILVELIQSTGADGNCLENVLEPNEKYLPPNNFSRSRRCRNNKKKTAGRGATNDMAEWIFEKKTSKNCNLFWFLNKEE